MSGAEFLAGISIAASIIQVVDCCSKIINRVKEFRQNTAFADLTCQLSLLIKDIEVINTPEYKKLLDSATEEALVRVLEGCRRQLLKLDRIIQRMTPAESSSTFKRVFKGVQSFGKDMKIQEISGILSGYKSTINLHLASHRIRDLHITSRTTTSTKSFFDVPRIQVSKFIGRTTLLERIDHTIDGNTSNPAVVVLTGTGGQGKTQIALEYCTRSMSKYKAIFWINTYTQDCAMRGFERVAARLNMPNLSAANSCEKVDYVKTTLRDWPEPWLLVFDNYDVPTDIKSFFPTGNGTKQNAILITSRRMACDRLGTGIAVEGLTEEEGVELLLSRCSSTQVNTTDVNECKRIVERLGSLALAIDQAAAYISTRRLPITQFLADYDDRREYILNHTPDFLWEYRRDSCDGADSQGGSLSVLTTWELSFEQLSQDREERHQLGSFLTQAAFFDHMNVKEKLFQTFIENANEKPPYWSDLFTSQGVWDSYRFQDVIAGLMNMSLIQNITITAEESKFSFHPLIKEWLQLRVARHDRKTFNKSAICATAYLIEKLDLESIQLDLRQEVLGAIDCCLLNSKQHIHNIEDRFQYAGFFDGFQTTFATFYGQHDRFSDAIKLFNEALNGRGLGKQAELPPTVKMRTMNNLCVVYLYTKQLEEAQDMLEKTLCAKQDVLGRTHPLTMNTINNIGNLYVMRGRFEEARSMYYLAETGFIRSYGREHKAVVHIMCNLGEISLKLGDLEDAKQYFAAALETLNKLSSGDNALALYLKSNLALVYKFQGNYLDSIKQYREVILGREVLFGNDHSATLIAKCELGDTLLAAGNDDEAEKCYEGGKACPERRERGQREVAMLNGKSRGYSSFQRSLEANQSVQDASHMHTMKWDAPVKDNSRPQAPMGHASSSRVESQSPIDFAQELDESKQPWHINRHGLQSPPQSSLSYDLRSRSVVWRQVDRSAIPSINIDFVAPSISRIGIVINNRIEDDQNSRTSSADSLALEDYLRGSPDPEYPPCQPASCTTTEQNTVRMRKHPAEFQCKLCPQRFTRAYQLRKHLRTHSETPSSLEIKSILQIDKEGLVDPLVSYPQCAASYPPLGYYNSGSSQGIGIQGIPSSQIGTSYDRKRQNFAPQSPTKRHVDRSAISRNQSAEVYRLASVRRARATEDVANTSLPSISQDLTQPIKSPNSSTCDTVNATSSTSRSNYPERDGFLCSAVTPNGSSTVERYGYSLAQPAYSLSDAEWFGASHNQSITSYSSGSLERHGRLELQNTKLYLHKRKRSERATPSQPDLSRNGPTTAITSVSRNPAEALGFSGDEMSATINATSSTSSFGHPRNDPDPFPEAKHNGSMTVDRFGYQQFQSPESYQRYIVARSGSSTLQLSRDYDRYDADRYGMSAQQRSSDYERYEGIAAAAQQRQLDARRAHIERNGPLKQQYASNYNEVNIERAAAAIGQGKYDYNEAKIERYGAGMCNGHPPPRWKGDSFM